MDLPRTPSTEASIFSQYLIPRSMSGSGIGALSFGLPLRDERSTFVFLVPSNYSEYRFVHMHDNLKMHLIINLSTERGHHRPI
jgi:hypothetical protein